MYQTMLYGLSVNQKTIHEGTKDESISYVYQVTANGPNPVAGEAFDTLEKCITAGTAKFATILKIPGVVDPRFKPRRRCEDDEDDD